MRTPTQTHLTPERRSTWSPEEDERLERLVSIYGPKNWYLIAKELQSRNGKSCRSRWHNYLAPGIDKGPFRPDEEMLIQEKHSELGNRWSEIAQFLPGRTDMSIKNYWNGHLKRKLVAEGRLQADTFVYESHQIAVDRLNPSASSRPIPSASDGQASGAKRARTTQSIMDLYPQIPDLSAFQNCKSIPHVIILAALLIQLREDDSPEALCQVVDVAEQFRLRKKEAAAANASHERRTSSSI